MIPPFIAKIFAGKGEAIVSKVLEGADKLFTSKEEKAAYELERVKEVNRALEAIMNDTTHQMEMILADKQNAREMFKANSSLQKIYAIVFLGAYVAMSCAMCYAIFNLGDTMKLPDWGIGFISTIWGAMSMKVGTVTDFLFGASMTPDKKD